MVTIDTICAIMLVIGVFKFVMEVLYEVYK